MELKCLTPLPPSGLVCRCAEWQECCTLPSSFLPSFTSSTATVAIVVDSHHCPASLPQRECSFSPRYQSVAISETLCTVIKVTFMLCSMLKGSVHHVKTYSMDGLAPLGLKESWRIAMTMNASPTGRGNKRCLNEFLMDCCKMTVRALLMPCGIISPECQCF